MEIKISKERENRIKKYVEEKRYKDINAFFEQAAYLLIMAEEQKDLMKREGIAFIGKDVDLQIDRNDSD